MKLNFSISLLLLIYLFSFYPQINAKRFLDFNNILEQNDNTQNTVNNFLLENAIYMIRNKEGSRNLDIEINNLYFINNPKKSLKKHFRIIVVDKNTRMQTYRINSDNLYCIEDKDYHKRLIVNKDNGKVELIEKPKNSSVEVFKDDKLLWKINYKIITEKNNGNEYKRIYYYLKNVGSGNYLTYYHKDNNKGYFLCDTKSISELNNNNYFKLIKMYREKLPNESLEIINKEPIDVLIKYIDLSDPNLKREGIKQIKKDKDNQELKYAVRSILKNIPWIRKIFILMPNERVRFFKSPEKIKEKIVYVKDKDLIGFDSASSPVFQFNLWRMKDFGMSENFILMDDDYFIGKPLNKSNFFYEENGKVYPALVTRDYYELSKSVLQSQIDAIYKKSKIVDSHSPNGFTVMQKDSLLFLYDILGDDNTRYGQPLIEPAFTHNAIPMKQSDIKEIYNYILKLYKYKDQTLNAKQRETMSLQPQTLFSGYQRNRYDRRTKMVTSVFYDLTQFKGVIKDDLFVVNVSTRKYGDRYYNNEIYYLEKLFPNKTPYELDGNNDNGDDDDIKKENVKDNKSDNNNNNKNNEKKEEEEENQKPESKSDENKNNYNNKNDYQILIDYLETKLKEKTKIKSDLFEIISKINELNEKYERMEKEIEIFVNNYNRTINPIQVNETVKKNITINENNQSITPSKLKNYYVLIIILLLIAFLFYIYKNQNSSQKNINDDVNYFGINSLNGSKNENEMSLMNSKIDI